MLSLPVLNCDDCGVCCETTGYPPLLAMSGEPDWESLPEELQEEIKEAISDRRGDRGLPCIWYDETSKKCRHYDLRPQICQDFVVGGEWCRVIREQRLEKAQ